MSRSRLVYLCNAIDDETRSNRNISSDSPAATHKVLQVSSALGASGCRVIVLSLGRGRQRGSWQFHRANVRRVSGNVIVFAPYLDAPLLTHVVSMLSLVPLVWRMCRNRTDSIALLAYNRLAYYLPALELANIMGYRMFLDLEDGDVSTMLGFKGGLISAVGRRINRLCKHGALLAASSLATQYPGTRTLCCYGVADSESMPRDWSGRVRVLLGGSLERNTGVGLFVDAIRLMRQSNDARLAGLEFFVTGQGTMAPELEKLAQENAFPKVNFLRRVTRTEYRELLEKSNVGLCLKLASSEIGHTTFPSKVIEIATSGMLLLTTNVSDVPVLLANDEAMYLPDERPESLANALLWILENRDQSEDMALRGTARVFSKCSKGAVGRDLKKFLFNLKTP